MISRSWLVVSILALIALGGNAWSQTPPPGAPSPDTGVPPAEAAPMAPPGAVDIAPPAPPAGPPSFKLEAGPGNTLKVGLLLQPQFQMLGNTALNGNSYNLFLRRTRVLVGGTLFGTFEYFFETDFPNLFLADNTPANAMTGAAATTAKLTPGLNIQDAFATWRAMGDMIKVDAGYMLPPMAHNAVQSAAS